MSSSRMALPVLPNPSNFVAVALVVNRSRDGPAFVFHYPPNVVSSPIPPPDGPKSTEYGDVDVDDVFEQGDVLLERLSQSTNSLPGAPLADSAWPQWDGDEHLVTDSGTQIVPWEHVAGFPIRDLANILTPSRHYHKKLFQVSLDPLYCISHPIHVPQSGSWKKKKKARKKSDDAGLQSDADGNPEPGNGEPSAAAANGGDANRQENGKAVEEGGDDKDGKPSSMTMFNLVFMVNPKRHHVKELVGALSYNILRKINKAYKYSQQQSDFVWKESKRILALKDKAREENMRMSVLWDEILSTSSLAASIQDIYDAVSQNKIAELQLDTIEGSINPSFQIPVPFYVTDLPQEGDQNLSGLWLSTADLLVSDDALDEPGALDPNFALLLLDDEKKIVAELQNDPDTANSAMVEFVTLSKPTISFLQVSQASVLSLNEVRKFAQHFILWRRAIAIPPLHARDVYILSPNSALHRLPKASIEWQKAFPLAPPLPNFLAELSQAPRPYKHFCPSKPHRPTYLLMLAWLMREGWVTQLCTFAYVVVWPEILYEVDYHTEADELRAADESQAEADGATLSNDESSDGHSGSDEAPTLTMGEQAAEKARLERIASKAHRQAAEKATAHARRTLPTVTTHPSVNQAPHLAKLQPYIIPDAKKATGKESLYLSAIGKRFADEKVAAAWPAFWKYFDGHSALERVCLQEDLKRKETWNLLTAMSEYLICVRHW